MEQLTDARYEVEAGLCWITIDRQQRYNSFTAHTVDELIACFKRAYPIFRERGYRTHLLAAAYRHHLHWSQLIGGDVVLTIPAKWQRLFNASDIEVRPHMDDPVPAEIAEELQRLVSDFRRAYEPDGLTVEEFDTFGATVRTLRTFVASYHDLAATVRDFMLPNPD